MGNCLGNIMSNVIEFSEKFSMFVSFTLLISCTIICMVGMLAFGIGLGYNYSYVVYRTKHVHIANQYKKTRPPYYWGPGYFKPVPKYKALRQQVEKDPSESKTPEAVEYIHERPEDLPLLSPVELIKEMVGKSTPLTAVNQDDLRNLYFSSPKSTLRLNFSLPSKSDMTTETITYVRNVTKVEKYTTSIEEADNASKESDSDGKTSKRLKEVEQIEVNVTKTRDTVPSFILKTIMHRNQLMKWLSKLKKANKSFAVHVIT